MQKPTKICSVHGCEGVALARGWCNKHYLRWKNHGDPNAPVRERTPNVGLCAIEGCGQPMRKRQWCSTHYAQWYSTGEATPFKHKWGEGGYTAVHHMLRARRGRAADLSCVDCGKAADEWSYSGGCPNELIDPRGVVFTRDLGMYSPRCFSCHSIYDDWREKVYPHKR